MWYFSWVLGLGLACARAFMAEGAQVALVSRTQAHLDAAQAGPRALWWAQGSSVT